MRPSHAVTGTMHTSLALRCWESMQAHGTMSGLLQGQGLTIDIQPKDCFQLFDRQG